MSKRTMLSAFSALGLVFLMLGTAARADYTVSGNLQYQDLEMDINQGFTGNTQNRPVRFADVLVMSGSTTLAQGATDANGDFSIFVSASTTQNISVLAVTNTVNTSFLNLRLTTFVNGGGVGNPVAYQMHSENNHDPNTNIDLGQVVALYHAGGDQFNLFDLGVDASQFLINVLGEPAPPGSPSSFIIEFTFNPNGTGFAFYDGVSVNLDGAYGYDDTILLHEVGHWVQDRFGDFSDNTGGQHFIGDSQQDPRLSFGESWPSFWGANVRTYYNITTGNTSAYRHPSMYMNSNGSINGGQGFSYDLENPSGSAGAGGAANEVAVQAMFWDITDGPSTPDFSPGFDDDQQAGFFMNRTFEETWNFVQANLRQPPFSGFLTYEDWHDLWIANMPNPQTTELIGIEQNEHHIEYVEDAFEPNNNGLLATPITQEQILNAATLHNTTWPENDEDWFRFSAIGGVTYQISTLNMLDGADTFMRLFDNNNQELANNDNAGPVGSPPGALEALRSELQWVAPADGDYFVQITRSLFNSGVGGGTVSKYGNWNFRILISSVPSTFPKIQVTPPAIVVNLAPNSTADRFAIVRNLGTLQALNYQVFEYSVENDTITDFSWVEATPNQGTVAAGQSDSVMVSFNSNGINVDTTITERLRFESNDLLNPVKTILIQLRVTVPVGIDDLPGDAVPDRYVLDQNYPNPFNPETSIRYQLPQSGPVSLTVFNSLGQTVRTLVQGNKAAGSYTVRWDGRDASGRAVSSGVYLYLLKAGDFVQTRKMLLLK